MKIVNAEYQERYGEGVPKEKEKLILAKMIYMELEKDYK